MRQYTRREGARRQNIENNPMQSSRPPPVPEDLTCRANQLHTSIIPKFRKRLSPALAANKVRDALMFTPEQLFIYNFEKLIRCHDNPTQENLFESVGPLRRLLLDHPSITSLANRRAQLKFRFTIYSDPTMRINYDPKIHPSTREIIKTMTLDEFLRHPLMQFRGTDITVKTAINYVRDYAWLEHKNEPESWLRKFGQ
ncbi:hypothetical protein [Bradyrhizobium sp. 2S1]|uniref:hypothetical protein n=1 Tax=Bradyrhizobium sp. 2S1 TaxID=1404429 RepID=UPI00140CEA6C|nr:hypothetical protein [Bradyrhizobium sp. 2S1]MCK7671250.1 hypothetical protein [Bradyrhizobium sp. 2S1]